MKGETFTASELKEVLFYEPETGMFKWRVAPTARVKVGDHAGCVEVSRGGGKYLRIGVFGGRHRAHRLAWLYVHGVWPKDMIDHINGNGLDNRISNLRDATNAQNQWNARPSSRSSSGIRGVSWCARRKMWAAAVRTHYETREEAIEAVVKAEAAMRGEFAPTFAQRKTPGMYPRGSNL